MTSTTIKDAANNYESKATKNITELKSVSTDLVIQKLEGKDTLGEFYSYNYIEIDDQKYRVPDSVLNNLKAILQKKPTLKNFAVSKQGEGRMTKYTVIPLD